MVIAAVISRVDKPLGSAQKILPFISTPVNLPVFAHYAIPFLAQGEISAASGNFFNSGKN